VPTPFYHLSLAEEILDHPVLEADAAGFFREYKAAFFLGNTAPDVQTVSGQDRRATHFFDVPIAYESESAWERMLLYFPELACRKQLRPDQAAFIAGYICHLLADWHWVLKIYMPYFYSPVIWETHTQQSYMHNVLRTHLDQQLFPSLNPHMGLFLQSLKPDHWLPFVRDEHLVEWKEILADQLTSGGEAKTSQIFAERLGLPVEKFYAFISSPQRLQDELYAYVPATIEIRYHQQIIWESVRQLNHIWEQHVC